jgi:hypothetical protein
MQNDATIGVDLANRDNLVLNPSTKARHQAHAA